MIIDAGDRRHKLYDVHPFADDIRSFVAMDDPIGTAKVPNIRYERL